MTKKQTSITATDFESMVGTGGLVKESHPATTQLQATTSYRYTGKNPDNYVSFNNELWRIIGVFDADDGTGNLEKRIKIIRKDNIGNIVWASSNKNDWTTSSGMTLLNSGDYWSRKESYSSTGLTEESKLMISDTKWYLGGSFVYSSTIKELYNSERGTTVYTSGTPTSWVGKVGLMYPSDYGYATTGGSTTTRDKCINSVQDDWAAYSDCKNNDWLHDSTTDQWTIGPDDGSSNWVFYINKSGYAYATSANRTYSFKPSVYLKPGTKITEGSGIESDPYTLSK